MLIAENWEHLSSSTKFLGWALLQSIFMLGWGYSQKKAAHKMVQIEVFSLLTGGWIMAGIGLMGQIFHLSSRFSDGFWLWVGLLAPLLYFAPTRSGQFWMLFASSFAIGGEIVDRFTDGSGMMIGSFAVPICASLITVLFSRRDLGPWREVIAIGFLSVCYFWWSVLGWLTDRYFMKEITEVITKQPTLLFLLVPVLGSCLIRPSWILSPTLSRNSLSMIGILISLPWILAWGSDHLSENLFRVIITTICWTAQITISFLLIRDGIRENTVGWINFGYGLLFISLTQRYFDLFEKFGFLKSGIGFILSGLFLFGLLWVMNRSRKHLLQKYTSEVK